jgi:aarF domain-containing kinase
MKQQLDLRYEANHLLKFNENFESDDHWAIFPKPIHGFVRKNILVETLMNGFPINAFMKLPDEKDAVIDPSLRESLGISSKASIKDLKLKLSDLGCRLIIKMIFFDNYIHGDLHPGEILFIL